MTPSDFTWFSTNNTGVQLSDGTIKREITDPDDDTPWKVDAAMTYDPADDNPDGNIWRIFFGFGPNGLCEEEHCPDQADVTLAMVDNDPAPGKTDLVPEWTIEFGTTTSSDAFLYCKADSASPMNVVVADDEYGTPTPVGFQWPFKVQVRCPTCELPTTCVHLKASGELCEDSR